MKKTQPCFAGVNGNYSIDNTVLYVYISAYHVWLVTSVNSNCLPKVYKFKSKLIWKFKSKNIYVLWVLVQIFALKNVKICGFLNFITFYGLN